MMMFWVNRACIHVMLILTVAMVGWAIVVTVQWLIR